MRKPPIMTNNDLSVFLCIYCGCRPADTVDHIPPKAFLTRPYPNNLLTVPACRRCNSSFQKNDDYTRLVTSIDLRSVDHETVRSNLPGILRSLQRNDAKGFARYFARQVNKTTVLGQDGRPFGLVEPDRKRIDATGEHIVRGLYFVELKKALPADAAVRIACKAGGTPSNPAILQFARLYSNCTDQRNNAIGSAFSYVAAFYPQYSIWLLFLYDHFTWLATISNPSTQ